MTVGGRGRTPRTITVNPNQTINSVPVGAPGVYTDPSGAQAGYTPIDPTVTDSETPITSGSGGGGGGGGVYDPSTDPVYAAYIANLDLNLAQQQQNTERGRAQLLAQQDQGLYDTGQAGDLSRQNISGNYESRGLFNSGGRLRDISQQEAQQGTRESRIRQGTTTGISDLENALAQAQAHTQLLKQNAAQGVFS